ncbi:MAG: hypothetical protein PVF58_08425 [Candidatus Methanofastidiosia archaeon]
MSSEKDLVIHEVTRRKGLLHLDEVGHILTECYSPLGNVLPRKVPPTRYVTQLLS